MVAAVRAGESLRNVARRFRVGVATVHRWVQRAGGTRLDRVIWSDRPSGNPRPRWRTPQRVIRRILALRRWLQRYSPLGEYGPVAVHRALAQRTSDPQPPSVRTIGRILHRAGLTRSPRQRRPAPPPGWYLPDVAAAVAELDSLDIIEGLALARGGPVEIGTAISLWGSLAAAWPAPVITTARLLRMLETHWRHCGRPAYVQFDNDTVFSGGHAQRCHLGRLVHWCLCAGVTPVFAPPRETGFQAKIESFNHLWQAKMWWRWRHRDARELVRRNRAFLAAHRAKHAARIENAPGRTSWPAPVPRRLRTTRVIFLRRTDARGAITLLAQTVRVSTHWPHRLVRCELDVGTGQLALYALRRRAPEYQPLLRVATLRCRVVPWFRPVP